MASPTLGVDPTATSTTLEGMGGHSLGATVWDHKGRAFTLVQANGSIAVNLACTIPSDFDAEELDTTNAAASYVDGGEGVAVGVSMVAIADNSYGWLARFGTGTDIKVTVAADAAAGAELCATATDGVLDDTATGVPVRGIRIISDDGGSGSAIQAELNWPHTANTVA